MWLLLVGVVGLAWLLISAREAVRRVTYTIPPGTAAGQASLDLPAEIVLTAGLRDTLVINNQDNVIHTFGPFVIGPHSTMTQRFDRPLVFEGACTFHGGRSMRLVVQPAFWQVFR